MAPPPSDPILQLLPPPLPLAAAKNGGTSIEDGLGALFAEINALRVGGVRRALKKAQRDQSMMNFPHLPQNR